MIPSVFTDDRSVLDAIGVPWWFMVAQLPVAGIVFALDGVLLGAGDATFMRNATLISALVGFLPLIWLSLAFGWGLLGIWVGPEHVHGAAAGVRRLAGLLRSLAGARARAEVAALRDGYRRSPTRPVGRCDGCAR